MNTQPCCFDVTCTCACGVQSSEFDRIIQTETRFAVTLDQLCRSNIGWFHDRTLTTTNTLACWELNTQSGVYLLWHKNDYCAMHDRIHMRSLYVGKGPIYRRLYDHWQNKDFSVEENVYWTYLEMPNRQAKYVEQLLLDLFRFPLNNAENTGQAMLCGHRLQTEVD